MESYLEFEEKLNRRLEEIGEDTLHFEESEFWMIQSDYEFIEYYAAKNRLINTATALPLARGLHNGDHRKSTLIRNDITYRLPYVIHPLQVARILIELNIPLSHHEQDVLYAAALCHDMIEDIPFLNHGKELMVQYHLDPEVYEVVKLVTKRKDFTEDEEREHFRHIMENRLALLVKLSDRSNNVEDLYNRSLWKVHEYVGETRRFFLPMADYADEHYPDIASAVAILRDKIHSLTDAAEFLVDRYDRQEKELKYRLDDLRRENDALRAKWKAMWTEGLREEDGGAADLGGADASGGGRGTAFGQGGGAKI
ncbi:MAG: HD domain-containing protein [Eubacteriales bacterium]|nr:HD domain-containing protein [Eubacteriales bacterium]